MTSDWKCYVYENWERRGYDAFFSRGYGSDIQYLCPDGVVSGGHKELEVVPSEARWFFPRDSLKLLVDAASERIPADAGMAGHLKDAIMVRDRLLTLVERGGA